MQLRRKKRKEKSSARTHTSQSKTEGRNYEIKIYEKAEFYFFSLEDNKEVASDAETNGIIHISQVGSREIHAGFFFF